jgi:hypothetical protein
MKGREWGMGVGVGVGVGETDTHPFVVAKEYRWINGV